MYKNSKCNYGIIEDLMNINEVNQTYSLISGINTDNLMRFMLFSFLQQRAFIFVTKNYLYIWSLMSRFWVFVSDPEERP